MNVDDVLDFYGISGTRTDTKLLVTAKQIGGQDDEPLSCVACTCFFRHQSGAGHQHVREFDLIGGFLLVLAFSASSPLCALCLLAALSTAAATTTAAAPPADGPTFEI